MLKEFQKIKIKSLVWKISCVQSWNIWVISLWLLWLLHSICKTTHTGHGRIHIKWHVTTLHSHHTHTTTETHLTSTHHRLVISSLFLLVSLWTLNHWFLVIVLHSSESTTSTHWVSHSLHEHLLLLLIHSLAHVEATTTTLELVVILSWLTSTHHWLVSHISAPWCWWHALVLHLWLAWWLVRCLIWLWHLSLRIPGLRVHVI